MKAFLIVLFGTVLLKTGDAWMYRDIFHNHNVFRKLHRVAHLRWNNTLQLKSQQWADKCTFQHQNQTTLRFDDKYGENLFGAWGTGRKKVLAVAPRYWYKEMKNYNYSNPGFSMKTGHFTQLVWKNTKSVGCGVKLCSDGMRIVVCRYYPPGNSYGQFNQNVLRAA